MVGIFRLGRNLNIHTECDSSKFGTRELRYRTSFSTLVDIQNHPVDKTMAKFSALRKSPIVRRRQAPEHAQEAGLSTPGRSWYIRAIAVGFRSMGEHGVLRMWQLGGDGV